MGLGSKGAGRWEVPVTTLHSRKDGVVQRTARVCHRNLLFAVTLSQRCSVRSVLATKSPFGTEYRTENPICCGLRTSGKREVCLKKHEDDHGPLEHQRTSRLSDGPFRSLPGALHANTTQTTATTCKIFFLRLCDLKLPMLQFQNPKIKCLYLEQCFCYSP